MNENILVVEDEKPLRNILSDRLRDEGYVVDTAADGREGFEKATNLAFDLIILDLMLPVMNGVDVCREVRKVGIATPIMILTVRNETVDKVVGLKMGADDYVTKPFEAPELLARIEVLLRRRLMGGGHGDYQFGSLRIDIRNGTVTRYGKSVYLTAREFQLLRYLIERVGSAVPRDELLRSVWGYETETFTRTVDTHVRSLRQKLEKNPNRPEFIVSVWGVGYKFVGETANP